MDDVEIAGPDRWAERSVTAAAGLCRRAASDVRPAPPGGNPGDAQRLGHRLGPDTAALGFEAIATTSSGFAATLGRLDQHVSLDEVVSHVDALASAVDIPLSVDAEHGYGDTPEEVATTVGRLAEAGAAGMSIEDYHPARVIPSTTPSRGLRLRWPPPVATGS